VQVWTCGFRDLLEVTRRNIYVYTIAVEAGRRMDGIKGDKGDRTSGRRASAGFTGPWK
jgi:hypothetical protein